jgi:hypothetical protein
MAKPKKYKALHNLHGVKDIGDVPHGQVIELEPKEAKPWIGWGALAPVEDSPAPASNGTNQDGGASEVSGESEETE